MKNERNALKKMKNTFLVFYSDINPSQAVCQYHKYVYRQ